MKYNTNRKKLIIPEYGRYVQQMVDYCVTIEDREKRNEAAHHIIKIMGQFNPQLGDVPDFKHKLWDQLFIMSEFKLEVDSPYPIIQQEDRKKPSTKLNYPKQNYKYRYYGLNLKQMITNIPTLPEEQKRDAVVMAAKHMKRCYLTWNSDTVEDKTIFQHMFELSDGQIDLRKEEDLILGKVGGGFNQNQRKNNGRGGHRNKRQNYKNR